MSAGSEGESQVWGFISTLVAGPAVWGAIGYGVDRAADTAVFTPAGVVVGFVAGVYLVYVKSSEFERTAAPPARPHRPDARPDRTA